MADVKISALPASTTPLAGTEVLPIVQSGTTVQVSVANLTAGRAIGATNATFTGALSVTPTWNAGATVFTGIGMNVTDTASAASSLLLDLQVGGSSKFSVDKTGNLTIAGPSITSPPNGTWGTPSAIELVAGGHIRWTGRGRIYSQATDSISILNSAASIAVRLGVDADDTLAQRNSTNAQTFRVYNTFTDASNYERGFVRWNSSIFEVGTENAGTGASRLLRLMGGNNSIRMYVNGADRWEVNNSGHFLAAVDNTYDIGASGATRPRNLYVGTSVIVGAGVVQVDGGNGFQFTSRGYVLSPSDGVFRLTNNAQTDFSRLQFGGTTSSFPALKRNGAELQCRLADDSSLADFQAKSIDLTGTLRSGARVQAAYTTAIPAGGTTNLGLTVSSTANFGVFFGSGAPTLSAAKGSLYLRSDGSTTNDRMYVNTDGATTWTAVTTAA